VRDLAHASSCYALREQFVDAALQGPLPAMRLALQVSRAGDEPQICSDHGDDPKPRGRTLNVFAIHDKRRQTRRS
jgi:hypothetical protein